MTTELHHFEFREGWREVLACFVGLMFAVGTVMTYTAGVFASAIGKDFGWTALDLAWPMLFLYGSLIPGSLLCGFLIDRFGARRIIVASSLCLALGLGCFSLLPQSLTVFSLAFGLLGLCSIGTLPVSYARVIAVRFNRRRGLALGIVMTGVGIGGAVLPLLAQRLIDAWNWRAAYFALGLAVLLLSVPTAWTLIRTAPQVQRELPRGSGSIGHALREKPLVVAQLATVSLLSGLVLTGLIVNVVPISQSQGLDKQTAGMAVAALGISLIIGRLAIGALMDRYQASRVLALFLLGPVFGALGLSAGEGTAVFVAAAILIGVAQGAEIDALAYLVSRHFSPHHFGTVYGGMFALFTAGAASGPLLLGLLRTVAGGFERALLPVAILAALNCLAAASLPRYAAQRNL